jgi:hypothetical protein
MCFITKTTYTLCPHEKVYTDRAAYHTYYFRGKDPKTCKEFRVNEVRINGLCAPCLERGLGAGVGDEGEKRGGEAELSFRKG